MSECSVFCVFAFIYLVLRFQPAAWVEERVPERAVSKPDSVMPMAEEIQQLNTLPFQDDNGKGTAKKAEQPVKHSQIMLLLVTSVVQTFGETAPLKPIQRHF